MFLRSGKPEVLAGALEEFARYIVNISLSARGDWWLAKTRPFILKARNGHRHRAVLFIAVPAVNSGHPVVTAKPEDAGRPCLRLHIPD